jgi:coenzyme F420-reducing hydrogenase gamma subunit
MIEKIDSNKIQDFLEKAASAQPNPAGNIPNKEADVSVQVDYAVLIDKAMQVPETDAAAVERARQLLQAGRLETIENIREAAENIVKFGI